MKTPDLIRSAEFLVTAEPDWPEVRLHQGKFIGTLPTASLSETEALIRLRIGGYVRVTRQPLEAYFQLPKSRGEDEMIHPGLGPVASALAFWEDRLAFHAGAFVTGDRAWGVAGTNEAGKSSLLAYLSTRGFAIAADDALIISEGQVFTGPRCIDLRPGTADRLGAVTRATRWGTRERLKLPALGPRVRVGGWFVLSWGKEVSVEVVPPRERIAALIEHRLVSQVSDARAVLDLATLPMWKLRRPKSWNSLVEVEGSLRNAIADVV